jgi:small subunit ribosomal protein S16
MGAKKRPFYRVVIADARSPRNGRFIETIGTYNPLTDPPTTVLNAEKAKYWLSVGAQPTEAAERILRWNHVLPPRDGAARPAEATDEGPVPPETPAESLATPEILEG